MTLKQRNKQLEYLFLNKGESLEQIGQRFNITRERVRQLLNKHSPRFRNGERRDYTIKHYCKYCNVRINTLACKSRYYCCEEHRKLNAINRLRNKETERLSKKTCVCKTCNKRYSLDNYYKTFRYSRLTGLKTYFPYSSCKGCHSKLCISWTKRNPEIARVIQARASKKYYYKQKELNAKRTS